MIKIEIANEKVAREPERTVTFEFRRHDLARSSPTESETVFLVARDHRYSVFSKQYPVKVDGLAKKMYIRRRTLEDLGFELVIEENK